MNFKTSISVIIVASVLAGCQTTSKQLPKLTLKEAKSFIQTAQNKPDLPKQNQQISWIQPENKAEPCLLMANEQFKAEPNARAFWDGKCKDGYADGFGRDIAISDYSHMEEITTYQNGAIHNQYSFFRDYVNNITYRLFKHDENKASGSMEFVSDTVQGFNIDVRTGRFDWGSFDSAYVDTSPFSPLKMYTNTIQGKVSHILQDRSNAVDGVKSQTLSQDAQSGMYGGITKFVMKNGTVQSEQITPTGTVIVSVPSEYWTEIDGYISDSYTAANDGLKAHNGAAAIETRYKHKVCSSDDVIVPEGLTQKQYTAICNYEAKFSDKYQSTMAKATEQYNAQLVQQTEQQRYQQEQLNKQQQLQAQRMQAAAAQRQADVSRSSNSGSSNSFSKTVQCTKLGQFLNKEIKTFNGMVCPIGWLTYMGW